MAGSTLALLGVAGTALLWPAVLWSLLLLGPLSLLGWHDVLSKEHSILRNFPILGHGRFLFESVKPEIQQYFVESNIDQRPIEREFRNLVYQRAKGELETLPFGTQRDVYRIGYEWAGHSIAPIEPPETAPRVTIGSRQCKAPYSSSLLNVSAMSYGALSKNAIEALNKGACEGGFAHNTGEGGISPYHLEPGGDLIWQIGTGYFGCRTSDGRFDPQRFRDQAAAESVKMIELKLSQGAKPGHGGILPGVKVTQEIARIRGVEVGETVFSPPGHSAFSTPLELIEFIARLRELSGGKPVGFKLCVGRRDDVLGVVKAMLESGMTPDFIAVDGGEGGTGAAPVEFSNSLGLPSRDALLLVHGALVGAGLRDQIKVIASGKIITGFHMVRALALGADLCASARAMMFALGCIQALRCNSNRCPTGVATQKQALVSGLDVPDKAQRVSRFQQATVRGFLELLGAMGLEECADLGLQHIYRRVDDSKVSSFEELYELPEPGQWLEPGGIPQSLQHHWNEADPHRWCRAS